MSNQRDEFASLMQQFTDQASNLALELDITDEVYTTRPLSSESIDTQATLPAGSTNLWRSALQRSAVMDEDDENDMDDSNGESSDHIVTSSSNANFAYTQDDLNDDADVDDEVEEDTEGQIDTGEETSEPYSDFRSPLLTVTGTALGDDAEESIPSAPRDAAFVAHAARLERLQSEHMSAVIAETNSFLMENLRKHQKEMQSVRSSHNSQVQSLQSEISSLRDALSRSQNRGSLLSKQHQDRTNALIESQRRVWSTLIGSFSLKRCFDGWRKVITDRKTNGVTSKLAGRLGAMRRKKDAFGSWKAAMQAMVKEKEEMARQKHLETVLKGVVERYETELRRLRSELAQAQAEVVEGVKKRRALEESLKTTLMRGMTGMQLEALDLFRRADGSSTSPVGESEPRTMVPRPTKG